MIAGSGIGLFYYLRIIFAMASQHDVKAGAVEVRSSLADRVAVVALTLVLIVFGVYPTPLIDIAHSATAIASAAQGLVEGE